MPVPAYQTFSWQNWHRSSGGSLELLAPDSLDDAAVSSAEAVNPRHFQ